MSVHGELCSFAHPEMFACVSIDRTVPHCPIPLSIIKIPENAYIQFKGACEASATRAIPR